MNKAPAYRIALFLAALALILIGVLVLAEQKEVLANARTLCLECLGIG